MAMDEAVRRVREGDRDAFRFVIQAFEPQLRVLIGGILPRGTPVDDQVQEAFVAAFLRLHEYQLGTDFAAWIRTLARHIALNERRRILRRRGLDHEVARHIEEGVAALLDQLAAVIGAETKRQLRDCLERLEETPRRIIDNYYFRAQSAKDLAAQERRPEPWVHVVLFRARAALGRCLAGKQEGPARG